MRVRTSFSPADVRQERRQTIKDTIAFMMHLVAWCLHDEFGFGHNRLKRALDWMNQHASDYMQDGEVKLSDVHEMLKQECDIDINFDRERLR